jgi:chemotaxis protein histidine kinase CheA
MMELFRSEVETHSEALTSSLLALEQDSTATATLERMMRAAHSIKGAARIMHVDPAVDVAHAMEDCFVAAQKGTLKLTSDDVDILLRGVDLLVRISAATKSPQADWSSLGTSVQTEVAELKGVLQGRPNSSGHSASHAAPFASTTAKPSPTSKTTSPTAIIACPEVLDASAAEAARRQLLAALDSASQQVHIDLTATRDLDAVGLAFLAAAQQHVAGLSRVLRFQPVSNEMQTVLQLTGLDVPTT